MDELPSENMYNILSRLPVKSLGRCRCVNKQWYNYINDPYFEAMHAKRNGPVPIMLHQYPSDDDPNSPCTLSFLEHKQEASSCTIEVQKKPPVMEFMCKSWSYRHHVDIILGSCNGLLYSYKGSDNGNKLVVIHPIRKECYELPLQQLWWIDVDQESSGLGFDDSTNTFKMVCVMQRLRKDNEPLNDIHELKEDLWTMVHVLGTNSWRKIPQVPCYPITGEGVFANGCLHWLISDEYDNYREAYLGRPVISFDIVNEEFGLINPPHEHPDSVYVIEQLVDLHGEVGYVYYAVNRWLEVWVLKERGWVMHCEFEHKPPLPRGPLKVFGFRNDNADIFLTDNWKQQMFVYSVKSGALHKLKFVGMEDSLKLQDVRMYEHSLYSTRYSIKQN